MPDNSSPAAAEGTCAHTVAEFYVRQHFRLEGWTDGEAPMQAFPEEFDPKGRTLQDWNDELRFHGRGYRDFIQGLVPLGEQAFVALEQKVAAASIHPQLFGTSDCLIWLPRLLRLVDVDYKYGFDPVDVGTIAEPNKQLEAYAIAAVEKIGTTPNEVALAVYQPRRHIGGTGAILELPGSWLPGARDRLQAEAMNVGVATENPSATPPVPGKHCRYCKAASRCGAPNRFAGEALRQYATPTSLQDMTDDEVVAVWSLRTAFNNFMEDVEQRVKGLVKQGHAGLTLKTSQGRQMWVDQRQAGLTLLALGRSDLVQAVALSDALHAIPETYRESLVKRSAPSQTITAKDKSSADDVTKIFEKYARNP